ncbi:carboxymuconolactone decarboxylase family protein [Nocardioides sp. R-C-SC26]|uniref:carboxymuconolactone decarboxylase family protein n=1 Tax=Nocardioides sp. R-C-SC26 TaxID=2870414 RepID=UPI001E59D941|nr:hypothetical protein [Nocardioides sp. R-C-SC26]
MDGFEALRTHHPAAAAAAGRLDASATAFVGASGDLLEHPDVVAFAEQFSVDVTGIEERQRAAFLAATGVHAFEVVQLLYVRDQLPRLRVALEAVFGEGAWWPDAPEPAADLWPAIEDFMIAVARCMLLDPVVTEVVRLRGARQHACRLCMSRRSVAAIDAGADEATFAALDEWPESDLPAGTTAALGLVDAMIWTPTAIPVETVAALRAELVPGQIVEVALDVVRNAANKIAVALGADAPEVDGVQLFDLDPDGTVLVR